MNTVPAAEAWDLYGGKHDGEPSFVRCASVSACVRACEIGWKSVAENVRASVRESSEEYSL